MSATLIFVAGQSRFEQPLSREERDVLLSPSASSLYRTRGLEKYFDGVRPEADAVSKAVLFSRVLGPVLVFAAQDGRLKVASLFGDIYEASIEDQQELSAEGLKKVAAAGQYMIQAAAALGRLSDADLAVLHGGSGVRLLDSVSNALRAAERLSDEVRDSLQRHPPAGFSLERRVGPKVN